MSYKGTIDNIRLIGGRSNLNLLDNIALRLNSRVTDYIIDDFANGEINFKLEEDIKGKDVFILQTGYSDDEHSINDYIIELTSIIDSCKRSNVLTVTVIMPFYPYSRSDKKDKPGLPIMAKVIANILQMQDITRLITMDLHSGQIQGFANFPFDNLYATDIFKDYFENELFVESSKDHFILVSPDNGSVKTIDDYASQLNMPYVIK